MKKIIRTDAANSWPLANLHFFKWFCSVFIAPKNAGLLVLMSVFYCTLLTPNIGGVFHVLSLIIVAHLEGSGSIFRNSQIFSRSAKNWFEKRSTVGSALNANRLNFKWLAFLLLFLATFWRDQEKSAVFKEISKTADFSFVFW